MHHHYRDIRDRIPEIPEWWDEDGVPRYCEFSPEETANIYADEVVLLLIGCQSCSAPFRVAMSRDSLDEWRPLYEMIEDKTIHYGDPPNYGCCPAGPTMNSIPIKVMEYWCKEGMEWARDSQFEVDIEE